MSDPQDDFLAQVQRLTTADAYRLTQSHDADVKAALLYLAGDIWQEGEGWVGPRLGTTDGADESRAYNEEVRRILAGANVIRDVVGRHGNGVLGKEPSWDILGISQADKETITAWWDSDVIGSDGDEVPDILTGVLGKALGRALCGDVPVLRLRVKQSQRAPRDLAEALGALSIDVMSGDQAAVVDVDPQPVGVAVVRQDAHSLAYRLGQSVGLEIVESVTIDEAGNTILFVNGVPSEPLRLGSRLTMRAMSVPPLVEQSMIGLQKQIVKTLTAMGRNTDYAGFAEVTYLNAKRPGRLVADPTSPTGQTWQDTPLKTGPGYRTWLSGLDTQNGMDSGYTSPSVYVREPVEPIAFTGTTAEYRFQVYAEAKQLHALVGANVEMSEESRKQAAADFMASLGSSAQAVQSAARWLLETAYALAQVLLNRQAPAGMRAVVTCNLSGTIPTAQELEEKRAAVGDGLIDRSHYQMAQGIADPVAEDELIMESRERMTPPALATPQPQAPVIEVDEEDSDEEEGSANAQ